MTTILISSTKAPIRGLSYTAAMFKILTPSALFFSAGDDVGHCIGATGGTAGSDRPPATRKPCPCRAQPVSVSKMSLYPVTTITTSALRNPLSSKISWFCGVLEDLFRFRKPMLYPTELRARRCPSHILPVPRSVVKCLPRRSYKPGARQICDGAGVQSVEPRSVQLHRSSTVKRVGNVPSS